MYIYVAGGGALAPQTRRAREGFPERGIRIYETASTLQRGIEGHEQDKQRLC